MKLLSNQSFSVGGLGGGARILRWLFDGREDQVVSIAVLDAMGRYIPGKTRELVVPAFPIHRRWHRHLHVRTAEYRLEAALPFGGTGSSSFRQINHPFDSMLRPK
jgi:hypothetical protein